MASRPAFYSSNDCIGITTDGCPVSAHFPSGLMDSHTQAIKEATAILRNLVAIEVEMERNNMLILDTVEPGVAHVAHHFYFERALKDTISGHGRLRSAYWRLAQEEGLLRQDQVHSAHCADTCYSRAELEIARGEWEKSERRYVEDMATLETVLGEKTRIIAGLEERNTRSRRQVAALKMTIQEWRRRYSTPTTGNMEEEQDLSDMRPHRLFEDDDSYEANSI